MEQRYQHIAVFLDIDHNSDREADQALSRIAGMGEIAIAHAFGNWTSKKGWREVVTKYAIRTQQQFSVSSGKNAADIALTVEAMNLLYAARYDAFALVASDSDYTALCIEIRKAGLPVYGYGNQKTPEAFRHACTRFYVLGEEKGEKPEKPEKDKPQKGAKDKAKKSAPAKTEQHSAQPQDAQKTPMSASKPSGKAHDGLEEQLHRLLAEKYEVKKKDEHGFIKVQSVGNVLDKIAGFSYEAVGVKSLSEFIMRHPDRYEYKYVRPTKGKSWGAYYKCIEGKPSETENGGLNG